MRGAIFFCTRNVFPLHHGAAVQRDSAAISANADLTDAKFRRKKGLVGVDDRIGFSGSSLHGFSLYERSARPRPFVAESLTLTLGLTGPIEAGKVNIVMCVQNLQSV